MGAETLRRHELAAFLRSRRERVTPEDAGLPSGYRRRTAGLRREEVAQLSGVGVTWYTWLEQGRPIRASVQVLEAVARTLRLDAIERQLRGAGRARYADGRLHPRQRGHQNGHGTARGGPGPAPFPLLARTPGAHSRPSYDLGTPGPMSRRPSQDGPELL